jgi:phage I-like protein
MESNGPEILVAGTMIDGEGTSWIEVMPTVDKARNGPQFFTVTAADLETLRAFIEANPERIPIDYDHAGSADRGENRSTRAAGWFTGEAQFVAAGEQAPSGDQQDHASVWARVKWTPTAVQEIRDGAFRFISPEWGFEKRDPKSGLMTKLKDLIAATLTNRPFFENLAPVQATAVLLEAGEIVLRDEDRETLLAALEAGEDLNAVLAAVWTTAYINDLPDSAFLLIEGGGSKDSDGKTMPRSLRHFPVRDAGGSVDVAHVRNALARIPQSNVSPAAKAEATTKAQRLLSNTGGNPSAADQGNSDEEENTMADDQPTAPVTDYMKALGLDETVDPNARLATAFRAKDEEILKLTQQVSDLTAAGSTKIKEAEELASRIEDLEKRDRARDIEVILARAVDKGRVFPAEKETLSELFASDVQGLKRMIATRPAEMFAGLEPKGTSGDPDRFIDEPDVAEFVKGFKGSDPVDTEQAKQHLAALELLKEQGKANDYTSEDYVAAYTAAASAVL